MSQATDNNKRIAKNTLLLYIRMLFMMIVSLYTSRVILGDQSKLNKIFSASVTIQILLSLIVVILIEIVGVWFLNSKMIIPADRILAANWVLQFSVVTFVINLISVPYNASIIAHEKMSAFAYISILEAIGKLIIAYLIVIAPMDKLVFYSILMCSVAIIIRFTYGYYCKRHFKECTYHFCWDKKLLKNMFGFAGWNFIGAASSVLRDQGGNVVINLFFGPSVNAAKGIAMQVNSAISGFVSNFMTALNPQITKSYASGNKDYMMALIFQGAKFSFYMWLWLKLVPEHAVLFVRLTLLFAMSESISNPLITAMLATGRIRNYQIMVGGLQMLNLPISYIFLRLGCVPESVLFVAIFISQCCLVARLYMLRGMIGLSSVKYLKHVYLKVLMVMSTSAILPILLLKNINETFLSFLVISVVSILTTSISIFYIGCSKEERVFVWAKVSALCAKIRR